jgi:hypothetical protein
MIILTDAKKKSDEKYLSGKKSVEYFLTCSRMYAKKYNS